mgnify:CR=1 FL=1
MVLQHYLRLLFTAGTANLFATKALAAGALSRKSIFGGLARQKLVEAVPAKSAALERKSTSLLQQKDSVANFYLPCYLTF